MKKCPYCAEEIQDEAVKCRHCGSMLVGQAPRVATTKKQIRPVFAVLGLLVVGVIVVAVSEGEHEHSSSTAHASSSVSAPTPPPESVVDVTAAQLEAAYSHNEVAADNQYKGKVLRVTGMVEKIGKDILDDPYITLQAGDLFGVQCSFDSEGDLAQLSPGMKVTVRGLCDGKMGFVEVKHCQIEDLVPPPCTVQNVQGVCVDQGVCVEAKGKFFHGYCEGPANIVCCVSE